jgi:hypothetical protein
MSSTGVSNSVTTRCPQTRPVVVSFARRSQDLMVSAVRASAVTFCQPGSLGAFLADPAELTGKARVACEDFQSRHVPISAAGQVTRVVGRFALIAAAGEMVTTLAARNDVAKCPINSTAKLAPAPSTQFASASSRALSRSDAPGDQWSNRRAPRVSVY